MAKIFLGIGGVVLVLLILCFISDLRARRRGQRPNIIIDHRRGGSSQGVTDADVGGGDSGGGFDGGGDVGV